MEIYQVVGLAGFKKHLLLAVVIRIVLIAFGVYHDDTSSGVKYTDVDYQVFTDASRHILNGNSPYDRHTYRYSPLIAWFLIPNITLHPTFGKCLFCFIDILVGVLIKLIVKQTLTEYYRYQENLMSSGDKPKLTQRKRKNSKTTPKASSESYFDYVGDCAMLVWLYNPITVTIGTRGNCDSLSGFLVLLTLYFLQKRQVFLAGLIHGLSIHFRLYPIIHSLTLFMYLSNYSIYSVEDRRKNKFLHSIDNFKQLKNVENSEVVLRQQNSHFKGHKEKKTIFKKEYLWYLVPNLDQLQLISGCLLTLVTLTLYFYNLYGYKFLYETYIYHAIRKDTRHNFSLYFYMQYLTAGVKNIGLWQKVLTLLPQLVLLLVLSCRYGLNKYSLNFAILTQTIVMVIYNGVLTSQYFVWIMAILPLCVWQIKMPVTTTIFLTVIWFIAQGAWLLPAYFLEFHGQNTFLFIWIQGVSFFCANIAILGRLIIYFMPIKQKAV